MKSEDLKESGGSGDLQSSEVFGGLRFYQGEQAKEVIRYVREEYGDELEFLWRDENGVWRNPANRKWYGLMMRVERARLGLPTEGKVEILDLRFEKGMAREFVASFGGGFGENGSAGVSRAGAEDLGILLGYHMNKDNWITVVLDYGVETEEVLALIDRSYQIVAAGK